MLSFAKCTWQALSQFLAQLSFKTSNGNILSYRPYLMSRRGSLGLSISTRYATSFFESNYGTRTVGPPRSNVLTETETWKFAASNTMRFAHSSSM